MIFFALSFFSCTEYQPPKLVNSAPKAQIMSHEDNDFVLEMYTVQLRGFVSDSNHDFDELTATWRSSSRELCSSAPNSDGTTICEIGLTLDEEEITLEAIDIEGLAGSDKVILEVMPSGPPEGAITSPTPTGVYYSDVQVPLAAIVNDAEADSELLDVSWSSDVDGELPLTSAPSPDGSYSDSSLLSEGPHRLTMTVQDPQGNQATDTVDIVVGGPNQAPLCEITSPQEDTSIAFGELALFRGTATDMDVTPNELTATWTSSIDGELNVSQPSADGEVIFGTEELTGGLHTITLMVTDEVGESCSTFILFTVSVPPEIIISQPTLNDIFNNEEAIPFAATVFDVEDNPNLLVVEWSSDKDGVFHTQNADSSGNALVNFSGLSADNHVITAKVTDTDELSATSVVAIEVSDCSSTYWYLDADSDGYGAPGTQFAGCTPPAGYVQQAGDCNDNNSSAWPGAPEYCDGIDNNCDNAVDEQTALDVTFWYADDDGDGYGDPGSLSIGCDPPAANYINVAGDCDDNDISVHPSAIEICEDSIDNDCVDGDASCQVTFELNDADARFLGHFAQDNAGKAVANAGDLDGDGISELLIAAPNNDLNGNAAGITYVVSPPILSGDLNLSTISSAKIYGEGARHFAGSAISSAGDVNNDGYGDLLIGAYGEDSNATDSGATYLIFGPLTGDVYLSSADARFLGEDDEDFSGYAVAGDGDFNGDGVPDLMIGAYGEDTGAGDAGQVYIVYGDAGLSGDYQLANADVKLSGESTGDSAGYSLTFLDANGDGIDDALVGAYGKDSNGFSANGAAYLVHGPLSGNHSLLYSDAIFRGEGTFHFAGKTVASGGDFNNDGEEDILIGATGEDSNGTSSGAAYILATTKSGVIDLDNADLKLIGEASLHYAGQGLAAGDLNGDGLGDLLIGAHRENSGALSAGSTYIVLGPESGVVELVNTYAKAVGQAEDDESGVSVAVIPDIDGDGKDEALIGAHNQSFVDINAGAAYLILGSAW